MTNFIYRNDTKTQRNRTNFAPLRLCGSFFLFFFLNFHSFAQIQQPVKWTYSVEQKNNEEADLLLTAKIDKGWHIYSQFIKEGGPIPTSVTWTKDKNYSLNGKTAEEGKLVEMFDKSFDMNLKFFEGKVTLRQKIKIKNDKPFVIKAVVEFMVCNDEMCLPPESKDAEFKINEGAGKGAIKKIEQGINSAVNEVDKVLSGDKKTDTASSAVDIKKSLSSDSAAVNATLTAPASGNNDSKFLEPGCGEDAGAASDRSFWGILIGGILGGFLALLTPCVFPMIPLTVSFFTKRSGTRKKGIMNALIYAASILVIYVSLGFLITVTFGSSALNEMASSVFFNMLFFIIFVIFAISFFGAFEITLPNSWVNKADSASDRGGLIGIFFMAFTLSLVSFSCTGPIIGTLLVEAAHNNSYMGPIVGMTGFSLALALPFALFATFPGWLQSLPKSGGWLNTVKVCLGFIELALALKFFSNVDLAYHWGLLKRELFISLWVVIFGIMGLYLLGKIKLSHDSDSHSVSTPRLLFAILTITFTIYLIPGIWGAPLKLISGFPPPDFYKEWTTGKSNVCPHDLNCFHDYDEGFAYARAQGKPVLIDFTGWACVNCRKMEDNVWSDPRVLKHLRDDFVLISLYVDDKTVLPEADQKISAYSGKKIRTTGNKWSDMQASRYETNSQPYYILLDEKEKILAKPRGYTPDINEYLKYLDEGLCRNKKRKEG